MEDIFAQLAAIRQSVESDLQDEAKANRPHGDGRPAAREPNDLQPEAVPTQTEAELSRTEAVLTKRNAPCPCGSGKRFKHCHGQHGSAPEAEVSYQARETERPQSEQSSEPDATGPSAEPELHPEEPAPPLEEREAGRDELRASNAMEMIVAGYVKVKDRRALTDLLAHRLKVLLELQAVASIDPANTIRAVHEDLAIIEAGLEQLRPPPGSLPENEWS
jgi:hypothetical protein